MTGYSRKPVVLSYGMGVDSTAILLRWLEEPESRDFELEDLLVITSMVGDEFTETGELVTEHILPRLREHGVRFVQVARAGKTVARDGITVLDDSKVPEVLHLAGDFKLSDEMKHNATIPATCGTRKCSLHAKGDVLDAWMAENLGDTPYDHVIGFNSEEMRRVKRDQTFGKHGVRHAWYPLVEWGWDRKTCEDYVEAVTGVTWRKSCCTFCPFSKPVELAEWFVEESEGAGMAMALEEVALRFNPRMALYKDKRVEEVLDDDLAEAAKEIRDELLEATLWAVYRMERYKLPPKPGKKRGTTNRNIELVNPQLTTRKEAEEAVGEGGVKVHKDTGDGPTRLEVFTVAAPAWVEAKRGVSKKTWDRNWKRAEEILAKEAA